MCRHRWEHHSEGCSSMFWNCLGINCRGIVSELSRRITELFNHMDSPLVSHSTAFTLLKFKLLFSFYFLLSHTWQSPCLLGTLAIFVTITQSKWKYRAKVIHDLLWLPNAEQGIQLEMLTHGVTKNYKERPTLGNLAHWMQ